MADEKAPALLQEENTDDGVTTSTDPQVEEDDAEVPDENGEGSPQEDPKKPDDAEKPKDTEKFDLLVDGKEPEPAAAPKDSTTWARIRKEKAELLRKNAEQERELNALKQAKAPTVPELGAKPKLEDFDYDTEKFETALESWKDNERAVKRAAEERVAQDTAATQAWQSKLNTLEIQRTKVAEQIDDYADLEATAFSILDVKSNQPNIIIHGAKNPAVVFAALGRDPKRAKEIASVKDPIAFAVEIGKLEAGIVMKKKTGTPPPEGKVRGSGPTSGTVDSVLESLRKEAADTGNFEKVNEHLRNKARGKGG